MLREAGRSVKFVGIQAPPWSAATCRRFGLARSAISSRGARSPRAERDLFARSAIFLIGALRALTKRRQVAALQGGA